MLNNFTYIATCTGYTLPRCRLHIAQKIVKPSGGKACTRWRGSVTNLKTKRYYSMPAGIFLLPQDICELRGVGYRQAINIYRDIREALAKEKRKRITVEEYAAYEMVPVESVKKVLSIK